MTYSEYASINHDEHKVFVTMDDGRQITGDKANYKWPSHGEEQDRNDMARQSGFDEWLGEGYRGLERMAEDAISIMPTDEERAFATQDFIMKYRKQLTEYPYYSLFTERNYLRHTAFATTPGELLIQTRFAFGQAFELKLPTEGDLMTHPYLLLELPVLEPGVGSKWAGWRDRIGYKVIDHVEIFIDNRTTGKVSGDFMSEHFVVSESRLAGYNRMTGSYNTSIALRRNATKPTVYYVPLWLFFSPELKLAFPLVSVLESDIRFRIKFKDFDDCWVSDGNIRPTEPLIQSASLLFDYVDLTDLERKMFTRERVQMIVEQVQEFEFDSPTDDSLIWEIPFSEGRFTCKEFMMVFEVESDDNLVKDTGVDFFNSFVIQVNSEQVSEPRPPGAFNLVVPYYAKKRIHRRNKYYYTFGLHVDESQPSGTINLSEVRGLTLRFELPGKPPAGKLRLYIRNYNIIQFEGGSGFMIYL